MSRQSLRLFGSPQVIMDGEPVTIARAKALGAQVKMLTGDNLAIAQQIAEKLGIEGPVREAGALRRRRPTSARARARLHRARASTSARARARSPRR